MEYGKNIHMLVCSIDKLMVGVVMHELVKKLLSFLIHVRIFDSAGYCENEWAEYMTNSERNMGILVSHNTSLDFVNITASVNNGPRSVYLHHIGTFQVYTSFWK